MKPSEREQGNADFLTSSFVTIPRDLLVHFPELELAPQDLLIVLQILQAMQSEQKDFQTPSELGELCRMSPNDVSERVGRLVKDGFLAIGERLDEHGTRENYFDLKPLWARLRGQNPLKDTSREWRKDTVTLFEEEFGRPLSGLECEQIRQWMERDGHADWLIVEALREAVLANKYSFKYIDRVLYDWQRNRVRTKSELETYRQSYRERIKAKEETAATNSTRTNTGKQSRNKPQGQRDERYAAFYQLFPDS